ncbi:MAG: nucleoside hydrolase [Bacteroidales bacterium]|nr:nucleoside hydrolase [Bacteroidales bacterium]
MKNTIFILSAAFILLFILWGVEWRSQLIKSSKIIPVIFETDMGNDIDDALALDMLYKYNKSGKIKIIGMMTNREGDSSPEFLDIMNTFYGYKKIPIGSVKKGAMCEGDSHYTEAVCEMKKGNKPAFKREIKDIKAVPEAYKLYRRLLSLSKDSSVVIISVGFSTNLARLMESGPDEYSKDSGKDLIAKKVKHLYMMAGEFVHQNYTEYNVVKDIPAAKMVFEQWPGQITTSPFIVGEKILYPGSSIAEMDNENEPHPMIEAYKAYSKMSYDRPTWDLTAVLCAIEPSEKYFSLSEKGFITVNEFGTTTFTPDNKGNSQFMSVTDQQAKNTKEKLVEIITSEY